VSNVEQRARMHAALGEPVRLAIVDHLALGDTSPGELGKEFELATNLLAHHLKVLQDAGLIRRVRSEGDRRRSYVQLVLDDPLVIALTSPVDAGTRRSAERVVFVCTRNSARSQLAAAAWGLASTIPGTSAGTHPAARVHPRALRIGRRHGLTLDAGATADVADVARPGDLLVAVCDNAHEELPHGQVDLHWAVPDPVRVDTDQAFETAYEQITQRVERLADAFYHDVGSTPEQDTRCGSAEPS
jgi:ArsR family transcriptional regulator, arsenate/arsenite/antimonite-responsive transcriptional repressor / arsenate reductase (thioredoxin)